MKREWNLRRKACALLMSGVLLATAGCTSKRSLDRAEADYDSADPVSVSSEFEEEGLYDSWRKKDEPEETGQNAETVEISEDISESEAKSRVLAEVMRISGAEDPEIDQTSAKIADVNEAAFLVSIDVYQNDGEEAGVDSMPLRTEYYRVDKKTGEVRYLAQSSDFQ